MPAKVELFSEFSESQTYRIRTFHHYLHHTLPNSMKSPMLGLRTAVYHVSNLESAKDWYSKAFQSKPYFDEVFYVGFNIAGFELGLHPEENSGKEKVESVMTYWGVENIEEEYARLLTLGATIHQAPQNVGGEIKVAEVKDPWGNILGLIYNPEFKMHV